MSYTDFFSGLVLVLAGFGLYFWVTGVLQTLEYIRGSQTDTIKMLMEIRADLSTIHRRVESKEVHAEPGYPGPHKYPYPS